MIDPSAFVECDADLEAVVGAPSAVVMLKSIRFLDEHCESFLACSPCAVLGTTAGDGSLRALVVGGEPGFASPRSPTVLDLGPVADPDLVDGEPAALLALVPGYGETLRVNGRLRLRDDGVTLEVEEAFLHCAKAIIRSDLWAPPPPETADADGSSAADPLGGAPFVVVVSIDDEGHADASPKGDPGGMVRRIDDATVAIADRPGNRRTDTLHNLMDDPRVALLALQPGRHEVTEIRGTARVSTDRALLESMRLRDRTPKAALVVDVHHREHRHEPALAAADLWDPSRHVADGALPRAARIWTDHVRRNTDPGAAAKVARRVVNATALAAGVAHDYTTNL